MIFYILLIILILFLIFKKKKFENFSNTLYFQHNNKIEVNEKTYNYVREYKKILLSKVVNILKKKNIKFVISGGNLLEYYRKDIIYQDDDIDIRFDYNDFNKWFNYCLTLKKDKDTGHFYDIKKGIKLCHRTNQKNKQLQNGLQIWLIPEKFKKLEKYKEYFNKLDLHMDVVSSYLPFKKGNFWPDVQYFFNSELQIVKYLDTKVYIPNESNINKYLKDTYKETYMEPTYQVYKKNRIYYYK